MCAALLTLHRRPRSQRVGDAEFVRRVRMPRFKVAMVGAGYFAQFHADGWSRMEDVEFVAVCDRDESKAKCYAAKHGAANYFTDVETMVVG